MENIAILFITSLSAATGTYYISNHLRQGAVRASSLLSLIVAFGIYFLPHFFNDYLNQHVPLVFIGASFIGMTSDKLDSNIWQIAFSSIIFYIIYLLASNTFAGFGGGLGTIACISFISNIGLVKMIKSLNTYKLGHK